MAVGALVAAMLLVWGGFILISTFRAEYLNRKRVSWNVDSPSSMTSLEKVSRLLKFSLSTSIDTLTEQRKEDPRLRIVNGMRVLCVLWVIILGVC